MLTSVAVDDVPRYGVTATRATVLFVFAIIAVTTDAIVATVIVMVVAILTAIAVAPVIATVVIPILLAFVASVPMVPRAVAPEITGLFARAPSA